jgi:hypothetical protein
MPAELALEGPWNVRFTAGPKRPDDAVLERLISWTEHPSDDVRYFSGIARYALQFDLPENWLGGGGRVQLDLGRLWAVGEVYVNGQSLGVLWKPPFAVDVSGAVRAGRNELAVEVANTWSNRLVGDAALPLAERVTGTNVPSTGGLPWKETPLLPSGLLGPVRLAPKRLVTVTVAED